MSGELTITTEQVDDFPVLIAQTERMAVPELLDRNFTVHGNWQGLSLGWIGTTWLGHILSVGDHRLNHVQPWVEKNPLTVQRSIRQAVTGLDFTDDRLESVLDALSDDVGWAAFETELNQRTLRVYDLKADVVRVDSSTASGYVSVTEDGLFQFGHSKDHRPDLPQVKVVQSVLDPLGMPVATQVVSGEKADDPLYIPAIRQVRKGLGKRGLLYVGDSKLMSLGNRAYIQAGDDYYLGPFSKVQIPDEDLEGHLRPVWSGEQALTPVYRTNAQGEEEEIAEGFEREERLTATVNGEELVWIERRLFVRSFMYAKASETALRERLDQAQAALKGLNERKQGKRHFLEIEPLRQAAEEIVRQYRVEGLLSLSFTEQVQERNVRPYGDRPAEVRIEREVNLGVSRNETAIEQAGAHFGWRVYGTNHSTKHLPLPKAVLAYRNDYLVERGFARLKGRTLSLTPMYLKDDDRVTGLIRLLSIGLRVLTLLEFVVQRRLAESQEKLAGLYAGNPKRTTVTPRAETLLEAFKSIYLNTVTIGEQIHLHITPLSDLQLKILSLLGFSPDIYSRLAANSQKPP
ncbi:MAG: IS1634 family transposase [Kovacikia sp.]